MKSIVTTVFLKGSIFLIPIALGIRQPQLVTEEKVYPLSLVIVTKSRQVVLTIQLNVSL